MDTKPRVIFEGHDPRTNLDVRVVLTALGYSSNGQGWPVAEVRRGHDACDQPRWERLEGEHAAEVIAAAALHIALKDA